MTVRNLAKTTAAAAVSSIAVNRIRGQNILVITGSLAVDTKDEAAYRETVTVEDPTQFALTLFREALAKEGIRIGGRHYVPMPMPITLAQHASVPLSEILKRLNKPSDNMIAECLLKTIGAYRKGRGTAGARGTGAQAAREFFASIGMDVAHLNQADGSGLSRMNFVSPRVFVQLLTYLHAQPTFPILYDSLPIAGIDGTLRNRLKDSAVTGNLHAKTGSLSHDSSLSGYITTKDKEMLVFSILMNNYLPADAPAVSIQNKIMLLLADYTRSGADDGK